MQFYLASIITTLTLVASVSSAPVIGQPASISTTVGTPIFNCGGTSNLTCPKGWRCCGPFISSLSDSGSATGTCHQGTTGVCPL
ncbi:hypothetical protein CVT24_011844 [Panaeolus cyanescens]|uniref:CBM1 domain-containing protein n=1 Tax=Panaeolus cyanescens TaxID=181874 RepID=A0A409YNT1_9AGAR|nr:hypothetical protein CVT24_011844 [Panaeolus cyanescens]